jgi:flagellar motor switch protein FliG
VHQPESPAEPIDLQVLLTARPTELRRLTRDVDVETWEIALCGADRRVLDHVLLHCESTLAAELADRCRTRRPVRLRELDAALELIGETWQRIQQNVPQSPAVRFSTSPGLSAA